MARDFYTRGPISGVEIEFRYFWENSWIRYGQAQTRADGRVEWNPTEDWWSTGPDGTGRWDLQLRVSVPPPEGTPASATSYCGGTNCSGYNCYKDRLYFWDVPVVDRTYTANYFDFTFPPPTPTPTSTSTPTPTDTPTPTPTRTPTPTPTLPCQDDYEPDDTWQQAWLIEPGTSQKHNFHTAGDMDYVRFGVGTPLTYTIWTTSTLGFPVDTVLTLYDTNCITLTQHDDNIPFIDEFSTITWHITATGTYFARVHRWDPLVGGCEP